MEPYIDPSTVNMRTKGYGTLKTSQIIFWSVHTFQAGCQRWLIVYRVYYILTNRAGQAEAGSSTGKKKHKQRKNLPIECATNQCDAGFCVHQPAAVPSGGGVLVVAGCVSVVCRQW